MKQTGLKFCPVSYSLFCNVFNVTCIFLSETLWDSKAKNALNVLITSVLQYFSFGLIQQNSWFICLWSVIICRLNSLYRVLMYRIWYIGLSSGQMWKVLYLVLIRSFRYCILEKRDRQNNLGNHAKKWYAPCADSEGVGGIWTPPPLKNHKNIGFLRNTGPDPLKNHKATKPFKWRFAGGPMMARF